jgi:hypothetical protein
VTLSQLVGEWRIVRNTVKDAPITAAADNDPRIVGGELIVTRREMQFIDSKRPLEHGDVPFFGALDRCATPVLRDVMGRRFNVGCAGEEEFGWDSKQPLFELVRPSKLKIHWLDDVTLYLTKRR